MSKQEGLRAVGEVLATDFDLAAAVRQTAEIGYCFAGQVMTAAACQALAAEADSLELQPTQHGGPLNPGTTHEVTQSHERAYIRVGDERIPVANLVSQAFVRGVQPLSPAYPELADWQPTEAGYQRYRDSDDGISPHRDSETDQLLAVTITVNGSSAVRAFEPLGAPNDYTRLSLVEECRTAAGSVMMLRAPGLAGGERTIHEARPPEAGSRTVLNLRMRPDGLRPAQNR